MSNPLLQTAQAATDSADAFDIVDLNAYLATDEGVSTDGDYNWPVRHGNLVRAISAREVNREVSDSVVLPRFVLEQAAERYFMLLDDAAASLKGHFNEAEFSYILNSTCQAIWDWDTCMSVCTMVADDNGVERLDNLEQGSTLHTLLTKLSNLSQVENATLVDACERVWRGHANPLL